MKTTPALLLVALLLFSAPPTVPAQADPFLIVPGRSLGRTHLGARGAPDLKRLPRPDAGDAAMGGRRWMVWKSKTSRDTLAVFAVDRTYLEPLRPGLIVQDIRATSPKFHTANGAATGRTLAEIKSRFPHGRLEPGNDSTSWFYTIKQGIAFEFRPHPRSSACCLSVTVFPAGSSDKGRAELFTRQAVQDLLQEGSQ